MGEKGEEIKKYELVLPEQSWDIKYSIENIVNNNIITVYGARWVLDYRSALLCNLNSLTTMLYT